MTPAAELEALPPDEIRFFDHCPSEELNTRSHDLHYKFLEAQLRDRESLIGNLEAVIDELEGELDHLRAQYNVPVPTETIDGQPKKKVLKGISFLSLDFGRLSDENLELRNSLKRAQLENRILHERCARRTHYSNVPICVDAALQTDAEGSSGATTPSIPADPLVISDDVQWGSLKRELQQLSEENNSLKEFAKDYQAEMGTAFESLRNQLIAAIPGNFDKLLRRYREEVELRRALHNVLIELRGNIRVFCRVKPGGDQGAIVLDPLDVDAVAIGGDAAPKRFLFDKIFGPDSTQVDVFDEVSPLIQSCLDGKNVSIFAYGQTSSGKTHTMIGSENDPGISRRAAQEIFYLLEAKEDCLEAEVTCCMIEIYNEKIRDLLEVENGGTKVQIRLDGEGRPEIRGIRRVAVKSVADLQALIQAGQKNRSTAATALNACSSRSHALVMLTVRMFDRDSGNEWTGRLNFIDLAGSERVSRSQVNGAQLQEAKHINKSLSELGNVVLALRRNQPHVPFPNCLLTRILEDSLTGDSKTLMIVQLTGDLQNVQESMSSLTFAERISNITRRPKSAGIRKTNGA
ncbi:Kinesin-like protein KIFC3 [Aphelenchoides fujianensis]|nr:Kinesin-like protein KIFC3 [Aphelenchoides fujianensis]